MIIRSAIFPVFRTCARLTATYKPLNSVKPTIVTSITNRSFHALVNEPVKLPSNLLTTNPKVLELSKSVPCRHLTKFSWKKGKKRTVKAVLKRFYRLDWGGWIRTKAGRHKRLWRKSPPRKRRLRQHVLCNAQQSFLLDKMVCKYWRKPKYYVDDPYEPYHMREEFHLTAKKPRPYFPPEEKSG